MDLIYLFIDFILHMDAHLNQLAAWAGPWLYLVLFLIIFCETGLVVTPFLPGDSLLFAVGALTASEGAVIDLELTCVLLIVAGVLGDAVNYSIGRYFGLRLFRDENSKIFRKSHLVKTQMFYVRHGGKTIILARFLPILRTFAPFVAGMGEMHYSRFAMFNVIGAIVWVLLFTVAGHFFGGLPIVKQNFHIVIFGIIGVSLLPIVFEFIRARRAPSLH